MKGSVWIGRNSSHADNHYALGPLQKKMTWEDCGSAGSMWEQRNEKGQRSDVGLCHRDFHRILPRIRLRPGADPIRVLMLGISLEGLTPEQCVTLREEADDLEVLAGGMRAENAP